VRLRECLVSLIGEANWLTHAKNAGRLDAEMALKPVEHLLGFFTAARMHIGADDRVGELGDLAHHDPQPRDIAA
jgi:hypothetical protein